MKNPASRRVLLIPRPTRPSGLHVVAGARMGCRGRIVGRKPAAARPRCPRNQSLGVVSASACPRRARVPSAPSRRAPQAGGRGCPPCAVAGHSRSAHATPARITTSGAGGFVQVPAGPCCHRGRSEALWAFWKRPQRLWAHGARTRPSGHPAALVRSWPRLCAKVMRERGRAGCRWRRGIRGALRGPLGLAAGALLPGPAVLSSGGATPFDVRAARRLERQRSCRGSG
jgi:hypothetical protein